MSGENNESRYRHELIHKIRTGFREISKHENWLESYEQWRSNEKNQFNSLMKVNDSFATDNIGDRNIFDLSDAEDVNDLDIYCMSVFLSEHLMECSKKAFESVRIEKRRDKKRAIIENYFELVDAISKSENLAVCILVLYRFGEEQAVLAGTRAADLYVNFFSLKELLRKRSTESIYLLFTYWRITKNNDDLNNLIKSTIDYIQTYFEDYNHDPEMHLYYPTDTLSYAEKLTLIVHWLEHIAYHTNGIIEEYKKLDWIRPIDKMADGITATNQISKFEMYLYRQFYSNDDNETVRKKAICNHSYAIWIKTVDVMYVICDLFQTLYSLSEDEIKGLRTTRMAVLENLDNITKIRDYYTRKLFYHQVYFQNERRYLDSRVMNALEDDVERFSGSVDDVIEFVGAIADNDIDGLLQTKQRYISRITGYASEEQQEKLDRLTEQTAERIKTTVQKLSVYDNLYASVSEQFRPYTDVLIRHPQILSSLVSAEYLYQQYVEGKENNDKFDYSCISIMYYMSLEDFVNRLIYIPYRNEVLTNSDNPNTDSTWMRSGYRLYVSSNTAFWDKKHREFKRSCEIGNLGFLLASIMTETYFEAYMLNKYPGIDVIQVQNYGIKLKNVAPRRNDAAHGGNYLTYQDVLTDKDNVYAICADSLRGLIVDLLNMLFR